METNLVISYLAQLIIAFGLINVWLLRFKKSTKYRGGNAKNMFEEFKVYGLPKFMVYVVGGLKIIIALMMLVGFVYPIVLVPFAYILVMLMGGAILMHIKVRDNFMKSLPAISMFLLAVIVIAINSIL